MKTKKTKKKNDDGSDDDDDFSVFSQGGNSLVDVNKQTVVFIKMKNAFTRAQQIISSNETSQTHLEDVRYELKEAKKNYEEKAPNLKKLSVQEIEELEAMYLNIKTIIDEVNEKLEAVVTKKENVKKFSKAYNP